MPAARPLQVLQTCFSSAWGGLEMQALEVSRSLRERGHDILLACPPASRLSREARAAGLRILELRVTGYVHPVAAGRLSAAVWVHNTDIVHCQHSRDLATVVPAVLLSGRSMPVFLSKRMGSYLRKRDPFHRFTFARVSRVLAVSDVIRSNVIATTPAPADRVMTLHDAVDAAAFLPGSSPPVLRREYGIPDAVPVIGMLGRFSPGKGHEDFLEAVRILRERGRSFLAVIVGEASHGEEEYAGGLRERVRVLGLESSVLFTGFREDVPAVLASFSIFAFPSHAESFGVALIEAMAAGLPVVSTNCDGVLDIVVDGETGIFVPPRTPAALADALDRLLADAGLRARLGAAGRSRVLRLFDRPAALDTLERVYEEVLSEETGAHGRGSSGQAG